MVSKTPGSGLPEGGEAHIKDISEIQVVPYGDDKSSAQSPKDPAVHVKREFKRADDIVYGEESHFKRNALAAGIILFLAIGIFFIFFSNGSHGQAQLQANTAVKKQPQLVPPGNGINVTVPQLFYNQTQLISDSYVQLFGRIGWDRPSIPSQGITQSGNPKWVVGPFARNGYVSISYFTNPGYNVRFEEFSGLGTSETAPARFANSTMLYVVAGQTYELDLIANPPVPYNASINNTVSVHVQVYYIPAAG